MFFLFERGSKPAMANLAVVRSRDLNGRTRNHQINLVRPVNNGVRSAAQLLAADLDVLPPPLSLIFNRGTDENLRVIETLEIQKVYNGLLKGVPTTLYPLHLLSLFLIIYPVVSEV